MLVMSAPLSQENIRERLTQELSIAHLPESEQNTIITSMSTLLLDRITLALLSRLPREEVQRMDTLLTAGQTEAVTAMALKLVPNATQLIETVITDTMAEYHTLTQQEGATTYIEPWTNENK